MLLARRPNFVEVARVTELAEHSWSAACYTSEQRARSLYGEQDKASPIGMAYKRLGYFDYCVRKLF